MTVRRNCWQLLLLLVAPVCNVCAGAGDDSNSQLFGSVYACAIGRAVIETARSASKAVAPRALLLLRRCAAIFVVW